MSCIADLDLPFYPLRDHYTSEQLVREQIYRESHERIQVVIEHFMVL